MEFSLADDSEVGWNDWSGGNSPALCGRYVDIKMRDPVFKPIGKRIVFCDEIQGDWRSGYFGMHRQMATVVCRSLKEAAAAVSQ